MTTNPNSNPSQATLVLNRLQQTPNEWVPMPELVEACGGYAVHSRISELRTLRHLNIEQSRKVPGMKNTRKQASFYRLVEASSS